MKRFRSHRLFLHFALQTLCFREKEQFYSLQEKTRTNDSRQKVNPKMHQLIGVHCTTKRNKEQPCYFEQEKRTMLDRIIVTMPTSCLSTTASITRLIMTMHIPNEVLIPNCWPNKNRISMKNTLLAHRLTTNKLVTLNNARSESQITTCMYVPFPSNNHYVIDTEK